MVGVILSVPCVGEQTQGEAEARQRYEAEKPLGERIKVPRGQVLDVIPPQLLRKVFSYIGLIAL